MRQRKAYSGSALVLFFMLFFVALMLSAFAIDISFHHVVANKLQTVTDASALAATQELWTDNQIDPNTRLSDARKVANDMAQTNLGIDLDSGNTVFGYIDPAQKIYQPGSFRTSTSDPVYKNSKGYNAVFVKADKTKSSTNGAVPTVFANFLNVKSMDASAISVAIMDSNIASVTGLRPFYACQAQFNLANASGNLSDHVARIYGQQFYLDGQTAIAGCPVPGSGNWGFADLRDCSPGAPGNSTTADWILNGYPDAVNANQCYSTQSGNFIVSSDVKQALDHLIANKTVITIPIIDTYTGNGSNTNVNVTGFTGFIITNYTYQGPSQLRNIEGYFVKNICSSTCTTGTGPSSGGGTVKLRLISTS